jgi:hypothetical protein
MDPRAGLDDMEKLKLSTLPGLELPPPGRPARSQSLYRPGCEADHSPPASADVKKMRTYTSTSTST